MREGCRTRRAGVIAAMLLLLTTLVSPLGSVAQDDDRAASVSAAAIELSRIERSGDLIMLHDMMAPDARLAVSRAALAAWYLGPDAALPTADPEVLSVDFGGWTWQVTGRTYADIATVVVRQPGVRRGEAVEQVEVQQYQFDGARWRWFFGADAEFIDQLNAQITPDALQGEFSTLDYARVDMIWAEIHAYAGVPYRSPGEVLRIDTLPANTGCGRMTDDDYSEAFYCQLNDSIYYLGEFADLMERQYGSYAWPHVIAHEWGHHIQELHDVDSTLQPELDGGLYDIEVELQADCLAGVVAQEAVARGWLTRAEVNDAYQISIFVADRPGTSFDDPMAHGNAEQRQQAFTNGLEDGLWGCNLDFHVGDS